MVSFSSAVADLQRFLREHGGEDDSTAFVLAPERREEAGLVDGCVARFVAGEMDPTRRLAVARTVSIGPLGTPPSLAEKLGNKLSGAGAETMAAVGHAAAKAVGIGWLLMAETEPRGNVELRLERTPEDIWDWWAWNCREMLEDGGIPADWAKRIRHSGSDVLIADLKKLKLTRFLGGSKLTQLGMMYAQAGVWLRIVQTEAVRDEDFDEAVSNRRRLADRPWRWEAYAVADADTA